MARLNITITHQLPEKDAINRIKNLLPKLRKQFSDKISSIREEWEGNSAKFSFSIKGFSISGKLIINSSQVHLEGKLPLLAKPFKGKIENTIREEAKKLLNAV